MLTQHDMRTKAEEFTNLESFCQFVSLRNAIPSRKKISLSKTSSSAIPLKKPYFRGHCSWNRYGVDRLPDEKDSAR